MTILYETDVYLWSKEQAALLEARQFEVLDIPNLVEEITSVGASEHRALGSHLTNLVMHMLKWHYQPSRRRTGRSWRSSVINARNEIEQVLETSPSLRREAVRLLAQRYPGARRLASAETGLPLQTFPVECPWTIEQVLDHDFFPEPPQA
jgi:hypothetical protein